MNETALPNIEMEIARIVTGMYESPVAIYYPYHNLAHTEGVVRHIKEMVAHYSLEETDHFILVAAGWFHDVGHLYGPMKGHEERSAGIMQQYFRESGVNLADEIGLCILTTKLPSHPVTLKEQIICDSDTYHFGTPFFRQTDVLVEKEMEMRTGKTFPDWHRRSLELLQQHTFFTKYCKEQLDRGKKENMAWLKTQIDQE